MNGVRALMVLGAAAVPVLGWSPPAHAIGCLSGGLAGAVAGHMVHHGVLGAVGGCIAGRHYANKRERAAEQARDEDQGYRQPADQGYRQPGIGRYPDDRSR
jgi:hypothetical protein